jgi:hypothetical protein
MSQYNLKPGDRVRVVMPCWLRGGQVGDRGTVQAELNTSSSNVRYFLVRMEKNKSARTPPVFAADEIQPDV